MEALIQVYALAIADEGKFPQRVQRVINPVSYVDSERPIRLVAIAPSNCVLILVGLVRCIVQVLVVPERLPLKFARANCLAVRDHVQKEAAKILFAGRFSHCNAAAQR